MKKVFCSCEKKLNLIASKEEEEKYIAHKIHAKLHLSGEWVRGLIGRLDHLLLIDVISKFFLESLVSSV